LAIHCVDLDFLAAILSEGGAVRALVLEAVQYYRARRVNNAGVAAAAAVESGGFLEDRVGGEAQIVVAPA
jgi:hypothetical protein